MGSAAVKPARVCKAGCLSAAERLPNQLTGSEREKDESIRKTKEQIAGLNEANQRLALQKSELLVFVNRKIHHSL
jgi:hypothetical protein